MKLRLPGLLKIGLKIQIPHLKELKNTSSKTFPDNVLKD